MQQDPHESHNRVERFSKSNDDEAFFASLNRVLSNADLPSSTGPSLDVGALPIIYIIGAPRSGTTLLSQLLSRYLPVGYIDNIIARFWLRPQVGIRLSRALLGQAGRESIAFDSKHGVTQDISGPHEFGYFWRHWLALDGVETHKLGQSALDALDLQGLQQTLEGELLAEFASPLVFKNVICGFQAAALTQAHPASLFVRIQRDAEDVTRSILKCRMERYGRYDAWWSLKPSTYPSLAKLDSPVQQVASQVIDCTREFEQELSKPGVRSLTIEYSDLVHNPTGILEKVCEALKAFNCQILPLPMPTNVFRQPEKIRLPELLEAELAASSILHEFYN
ncbi:MAG: sulfotransferase [Pseudomonadota bacterium]